MNHSPGVLEAKAPVLSTDDTARIAEELLGIVGLDGLHANVSKIRPPMVFSASDAERLLDAVDDSLALAWFRLPRRRAPPEPGPAIVRYCVERSLVTDRFSKELRHDL